MADIFDPTRFEEKLRRLVHGYRQRYGELLSYDVDEEIARFNEYRPKLAKYVVDAVTFMKHAQESNMNVVIEGANVSSPFSTILDSRLTIFGPSNCDCGLRPFTLTKEQY